MGTTFYYTCYYQVALASQTLLLLETALIHLYITLASSAMFLMSTFEKKQVF